MARGHLATQFLLVDSAFASPNSGFLEDRDLVDVQCDTVQNLQDFGAPSLPGVPQETTIERKFVRLAVCAEFRRLEEGARCSGKLDEEDSVVSSIANCCCRICEQIGSCTHKKVISFLCSEIELGHKGPRKRAKCFSALYGSCRRVRVNLTVGKQSSSPFQIASEGKHTVLQDQTRHQIN